MTSPLLLCEHLLTQGQVLHVTSPASDRVDQVSVARFSQPVVDQLQPHFYSQRKPFGVADILPFTCRHFLWPLSDFSCSSSPPWRLSRACEQTVEAQSQPTGVTCLHKALVVSTTPFSLSPSYLLFASLLPPPAPRLQLHQLHHKCRRPGTSHTSHTPHGGGSQLIDAFHPTP